MAVSAKLYGLALQSLVEGEVALTADTIKVMLCTSSYVPDQDTHRYKDDVTNEVTGTGYTAGGATLGSKTVTYDTASNTLTFDAADAAWSGSTLTAAFAVIYDDTPATDATKPLLAYVDFDGDKVSSAGTFTIQWSADGIFSITAA